MALFLFQGSRELMLSENPYAISGRGGHQRLDKQTLKKLEANDPATVRAVLNDIKQNADVPSASVSSPPFWLKAMTFKQQQEDAVPLSSLALKNLLIAAYTERSFVIDMTKPLAPQLQQNGIDLDSEEMKLLAAGSLPVTGARFEHMAGRQSYIASYDQELLFKDSEKSRSTLWRYDYQAIKEEIADKLGVSLGEVSRSTVEKIVSQNSIGQVVSEKTDFYSALKELNDNGTPMHFTISADGKARTFSIYADTGGALALGEGNEKLLVFPPLELGKWRVDFREVKEKICAEQGKSYDQLKGDFGDLIAKLSKIDMNQTGGPQPIFAVGKETYAVSAEPGGLRLFKRSSSNLKISEDNLSAAVSITSRYMGEIADEYEKLEGTLTSYYYNRAVATVHRIFNDVLADNANDKGKADVLEAAKAQMKITEGNISKELDGKGHSIEEGGKISGSSQKNVDMLQVYRTQYGVWADDVKTRLEKELPELEKKMDKELAKIGVSGEMAGNILGKFRQSAADALFTLRESQKPVSEVLADFAEKREDAERSFSNLEKTTRKLAEFNNKFHAYVDKYAFKLPDGRQVNAYTDAAALSRTLSYYGIGDQLLAIGGGIAGSWQEGVAKNRNAEFSMANLPPFNYGGVADVSLAAGWYGLNWLFGISKDGKKGEEKIGSFSDHFWTPFGQWNASLNRFILYSVPAAADMTLGLVWWGMKGVPYLVTKGWDKTGGKWWDARIDMSSPGTPRRNYLGFEKFVREVAGDRTARDVSGNIDESKLSSTILSNMIDDQVLSLAGQGPAWEAQAEAFDLMHREPTPRNMLAASLSTGTAAMTTALSLLAYFDVAKAGTATASQMSKAWLLQVNQAMAKKASLLVRNELAGAATRQSWERVLERMVRNNVLSREELTDLIQAIPATERKLAARNLDRISESLERKFLDAVASRKTAAEAAREAAEQVLKGSEKQDFLSSIAGKTDEEIERIMRTRLERVQNADGVVNAGEKKFQDAFRYRRQEFSTPVPAKEAEALLSSMVNGAIPRTRFFRGFFSSLATSGGNTWDAMKKAWATRSFLVSTTEKASERHALNQLMPGSVSLKTTFKQYRQMLKDALKDAWAKGAHTDKLSKIKEKADELAKKIETEKSALEQKIRRTASKHTFEKDGLRRVLDLDDPRSMYDDGLISREDYKSLQEFEEAWKSKTDAEKWSIRRKAVEERIGQLDKELADAVEQKKNGTSRYRDPNKPDKLTTDELEAKINALKGQVKLLKPLVEQCGQMNYFWYAYSDLQLSIAASNYAELAKQIKEAKTLQMSESTRESFNKAGKVKKKFLSAKENVRELYQKLKNSGYGAKWEQLSDDIADTERKMRDIRARINEIEIPSLETKYPELKSLFDNYHLTTQTSAEDCLAYLRRRVHPSDGQKALSEALDDYIKAFKENKFEDIKAIREKMIGKGEPSLVVKYPELDEFLSNYDFNTLKGIDDCRTALRKADWVDLNEGQQALLNELDNYYVEFEKLAKLKGQQFGIYLKVSGAKIGGAALFATDALFLGFTLTSTAAFGYIDWKAAQAFLATASRYPVPTSAVLAREMSQWASARSDAARTSRQFRISSDFFSEKHEEMDWNKINGLSEGWNVAEKNAVKAVGKSQLNAALATKAINDLVSSNPDYQGKPEAAARAVFSQLVADYAILSSSDSTKVRNAIEGLPYFKKVK